MGEDYRYFADLAGEVNIPQDGITSRTLYTDEHTKVVLFGFGAGQELSQHTASMPAMLHFIQGEGKVTLGSDEQVATPGTWAYMPANLPHSVLAQTPLVMLLILLKSTKQER